MKVSLVDVDGTGFPNLALMKLAAWHKKNGDSVDWYEPLFSRPDRIYASRIFTFSEDYQDYAPDDPDPVKGGTGYDIKSRLPDEVDRMLPDYSIYPAADFAIGYLSRGCIRKCPWCVVPRKEGMIARYTPVETVSLGADLVRRKKVVLMDNNFLATELGYIEEQIDVAGRLGLRLDFNQGLDARLVTDVTARLLCRVHWLNYVRFSCDTASMIGPVTEAVRTMRRAGYTGVFFIYLLAQDWRETHDRIMRITSVDPKIQPYVMIFRDLDGDGRIVDPDGGLKHLRRWANSVVYMKSASFGEYLRHVRSPLSFPG